MNVKKWEFHIITVQVTKAKKSTNNQPVCGIHMPQHIGYWGFRFAQQRQKCNISSCVWELHICFTFVSVHVAIAKESTNNQLDVYGIHMPHILKDIFHMLSNYVG